jgi:hypothetical protein
LGDLFFHEESGGYGKRFPRDSVTEAILARLEQVLLPMLRQTARLEPAPGRQPYAKSLVVWTVWPSIGGWRVAAHSQCEVSQSNRVISTWSCLVKMPPAQRWRSRML